MTNKTFVLSLVGSRMVTRYMPAQGKIALCMCVLWRTENELQSNIAASMQPAGYIQACRGLLIAAVSLGFFGSIFALVGMKCTKIGGSEDTKAKLTTFSGLLFIMSGQRSAPAQECGAEEARHPHKASRWAALEEEGRHQTKKSDTHQTRPPRRTANPVVSAGTQSDAVPFGSHLTLQLTDEWDFINSSPSGDHQSSGAEVMGNLNGLCAMSGVSLYAHKITSEFFDPTFVEQKYELGAALFIGWAGSSLTVIGGAILCLSLNDAIKKERLNYPYNGAKSMRSAHTSHQDQNNNRNGQRGIPRHFDKNAYYLKSLLAVQLGVTSQSSLGSCAFTPPSQILSITSQQCLRLLDQRPTVSGKEGGMKTSRPLLNPSTEFAITTSSGKQFQILTALTNVRNRLMEIGFTYRKAKQMPSLTPNQKKVTMGYGKAIVDCG
ncbi:unnamed protein product [Ranitomeya imitator]|uniref:Uncharacterized protein n=1 Tax=Ranitomeya imitator TaxID=111125 RepID=A0ABN9L6V1_9NEOB|nr:unnamed protein product [Ranitomeya imitator]